MEDSYRSSGERGQWFSRRRGSGDEPSKGGVALGGVRDRWDDLDARR